MSTKRLSKLQQLTVAILAMTPFGVMAGNPPNKESAPKSVTYKDHIRPLFRRYCFACHNQGQAKADLDLSKYRGAMAGGSSGKVLVPGDPSQSRLYLLVTHAEKPSMPPKRSRLQEKDLNLVKLWIEGGLLETVSSQPQRSSLPKSVLALRLAPVGKPSGPPLMPKNISARPFVRTSRANTITALASSPWAPVFAVGGQKQVLLHHTESLKLLGVLPYPGGLPYTVKFSRNGRLLLAAGGRGGESGQVLVWDVTTGKKVTQVGDEFDSIFAADISPDQSLIALGGADFQIKVFSTESGELLKQIEKHTDWIVSLEFSPNGKMFATGDRSGGLSIWESKTGDELYTLRGHRKAIGDISWRSDSLVLASVSEDGSLKLWDSRDGSLAKGWTAHEKGVLSVKYTHYDRLATCGRDCITKVWDQNGACRREFEPLVDVATRVTFSHDGSRVIAGDWTGQVHIWNVADGTFLGRLSSNPAHPSDR